MTQAGIKENANDWRGRGKSPPAQQIRPAFRHRPAAAGMGLCQTGLARCFFFLPPGVPRGVGLAAPQSGCRAVIRILSADGRR